MKWYVDGSKVDAKLEKNLKEAIDGPDFALSIEPYENLLHDLHHFAAMQDSDTHARGIESITSHLSMQLLAMMPFDRQPLQLSALAFHS